MTTYEITSATGNAMGTYTGATPAEALAAMHRDAGYRVTVEGDEIVFASEGDAEVCGGIDAWTVREVAAVAAAQAFADATDLRITAVRADTVVRVEATLDGRPVVIVKSPSGTTITGDLEVILKLDGEAVARILASAAD